MAQYIRAFSSYIYIFEIKSLFKSTFFKHISLFKVSEFTYQYPQSVHVVLPVTRYVWSLKPFFDSGLQIQVLPYLRSQIEEFFVTI